MTARPGSTRGRAIASRPRGPRPTVRGWALLVIGALAVAAAVRLDRADLLLVGCALLAAPLLSLITLRASRPRLEVRRQLSDEAIAVGETAQVFLGLRNLSRLPTAAMRWRDRRSAELDGVPRGSLAELGGRGHSTGMEPATLRYPVRPRRRGSFTVGPLVLLRSDPLGLVSVETAVGGRSTLLATPRVSELSEAKLEGAAPDGGAVQLLRPALVTSDDVLAREYRPGDPWRRMHWGATARRDELMVRQEEHRSNPQAWILFDTASAGASMRGARHEPFERAVELLASVAAHAMSLGYAVGVVETAAAGLAGRTGAPGGGAMFEPPVGEAELVIQLATIGQSRDADPVAVARFADALQRAGSGTPAFVVLCDGGEAFAQELAAARPLAEPAIAFLASERARAAQPMLEAAGWSCVPLGPGTDPLTAWALARVLAEAGPGDASGAGVVRGG